MTPVAGFAPGTAGWRPVRAARAARKCGRRHVAWSDVSVGPGMRPVLSLEGRRRVFRWYFDHGLSIGDIKRKLDGCRADGSPIEGEPFISRRTLQRLVKQFKETGDFAFSKRKRRIDALSDDVIQAIKDVVDEEPSRYLDEMKERLYQKHKIRTSMATICRCIHAPAPHGLGYSRLVLQRSAIEKNHAERVAFRQLIIGFDPKQFIFFDEVHKGRNESSRRRCYANRGSKYIIHQRFDPSTFSMTVALNFEGFVADTCFTTRETMNADSHYLWVDVFLARHLNPYDARKLPNSIVVFDNVAFHWDQRCLDRMRETGALLFPLPAYSPAV